ncbi:MAG: hypothetical protein JWN95_3262 [Frankiales bacterium]|nr:hypothetical protein [Frankiales bacterium]
MPEPAADTPTILDLARRVVISGVPVASALVFVTVAIKVFRAAHMETSTTVAVVSSANAVDMLKGVLLTLLPGFLAALVAVAIWWWIQAVPVDGASGAPLALWQAESGLMWSLMAVAFFTLPWIVFALFALPVVALVLVSWLAPGRRRLLSRMRTALIRIAIVTALVSTTYLAVSTDVWLPLRSISLRPGQTVTIGGQVLSQGFAAYILSSDKDNVRLLLDTPRAVIDLDASAIAPNPQICIPKPAHRSWLLRPSQELHWEGSFPSPYPVCPVSA